MGFLLAMTLPMLVLALTVLGTWEVLRARARGTARSAMASTGFDILQEALYPAKRHEIEQREHESLMAEEDADGAPPRSGVDLRAGTAHIHLRRRPAASTTARFVDRPASSIGTPVP